MTQDKEQAPSMTRGLAWLSTILFFTAGVLCSDVSAGPLYRWVDEKGVTHVTDSPPERPAGREEPPGVAPPAGERRSAGTARATDSREFVARSSEWLKDPSITSEIITTIRPVKDKTYKLTVQHGSDYGMGHSFYIFCVVHHFAASKGYNGWRETVVDEANGGPAKKEKNEIFFTLVPSAPGKNAEFKENICRKLLRPQYMWNDVEVEYVTQKPVCRKLIRILADGELNPRKKVNKDGMRGIFEYAVDVDGDGRLDKVTEKGVDQKSTITVQCASGKTYTLDEDGYVSLVNLNGKEHVLVNYVKWDRDRKRGHTTGRRLYELTKDRAKLVCDREDLKEILN
jgi:hypothetical protein